jgi:hypothetical protein
MSIIGIPSRKVLTPEKDTDLFNMYETDGLDSPFITLIYLYIRVIMSDFFIYEMDIYKYKYKNN